MEDTIPLMAEKNTSITGVIKQYGERLLGFIRGRVNNDDDAEDILQDVWYQLSNAVDIDNIEQMSGWLHRVAKNKIIDRSRKKTPELLDDFIYEDEDGEFNFKEILLADNFTPETQYLRDIFWEELFTALNELPENQRQVFIWNEMEDLTLNEIAQNTNENIKTIISRKGYAVKHLRKRLQNLYTEFLNY